MSEAMARVAEQAAKFEEERVEKVKRMARAEEIFAKLQAGSEESSKESKEEV